MDFACFAQLFLLLTSIYFHRAFLNCVKAKLLFLRNNHEHTELYVKFDTESFLMYIEE